MVAVLSPILVLLLLELALRMAGFGYPTSFFVPDPTGRTGIYVDNQYFGWRFFPRAAARSPQPLAVAVPKPAGTFRVLVLGESAAMGDPEPAYGLARQLERVLQTQMPGSKVEVLNLAMTAINSHVIREIARDASFLQADAWVIYAGNNEVVGPFGAGTVFGRRAAPLWFVRAQLWSRKAKLVQALDALLQRDSRGLEWMGMEMFLQHRVQRTDPDLRTVQENFEANLEEVIQLGKEAGAEVVIATMAVNLEDCPPFGSAHRGELAGERRQQWEQAFKAGVAAQDAKQFREALAAYETAFKLNDGHAELAYRIGQCLSAREEETGARSYFALARDLDVLRFRADTESLRRTREVCQREEAALVDAAELIRPKGRDPLFHDHVHLSFHGNHWLATTIGRAILQRTNSVDLPGPGEIARSLAYTPYDERRIVEEMRQRMRQPPFTLQLNHPGRDALLTERLRDLLEEPPQAHLPAYREAIQRFPDDWVLHARFARLLESCGDMPEARAEWEIVARLMPHVPDPKFHLGDIALGEGKPQEAIPFFLDALRLKPGSVETINSLGLAYSALGRAERAKEQFRRALKVNGSYAAARVNLGTELARSGQAEEAATEFTRVLSANTNHVAARINLGKLRAAQGKQIEALRLFSEAATIDTSNSVVCFNLGNTLSTLGRHEEAARWFQAAVTHERDFVDARYSLAMELTRLRRLPEAVAELQQVVGLRPGAVEARYNLGIALARMGKMEQAMQEFRATLELAPEHLPAREALDKALKLSGGSPDQSSDAGKAEVRSRNLN